MHQVAGVGEGALAILSPSEIQSVLTQRLLLHLLALLTSHQSPPTNSLVVIEAVEIMLARYDFKLSNR